MSTETAYVHSAEYSEKTVQRDGAPSQIDLLSMRCKVDRSRKVNGDWDDSKSFWVDVSLWGPRVKYMKGVIVPGIEVVLMGRYDGATWNDKQSGEQRSAIKFVADDIAISPYIIESVAYKTNKSSAQIGAAGAA